MSAGLGADGMQSIKLALRFATTLALVTTAQAIRPPADREAVDPLRRADLAAVFDGAGAAPAGWEAARDKLPESCRNLRAIPERECDDELRCVWLGARAAAIAAFSGGGLDARVGAAEGLTRVADRLAGAARCGRDEATQARWREDRIQAGRDAGHAWLALLAAPNAPAPAGPPVVAPAEARRVDEALRRVRTQGIAQLATVDVIADRTLYRTVWQRRTWLARLPALAAMRQLMTEVAGGRPLPSECGAELVRDDLLEDQWRGHLVQEAVPQALACVLRGVPRAGWRGAAGNQRALELGTELSAAARSDAGGRDFGADPDRARQVLALVDLLQGRNSTAQAGGRSAATPPGRAGAAAERAAREAPRAATSRAPRVSAPSIEPAASPIAARPQRPGSTLDAERLIRIAAAVGERIGDTDRLHQAAKRARTPEQRAQQLSALLIELHRAVCAPLDAIDPSDLDAARRVLQTRGATAREAACRGGGDPLTDLEVLLTEAPRLQRLYAAAALRSAAGLTAMRQPGEAGVLLETVPEPLRGETWAVIAAWTARARGDQVAASRAIARITPERLERLRSTGAEPVARLVAHASVAAN